MTILAAPAHVVHHTTTASSNGGAAVILVGLTIWILFWLRGKLTFAQLIVCGTWGVLVGATTFGTWLHGPLSDLGHWVTGIAS